MASAKQKRRRHGLPHAPAFSPEEPNDHRRHRDASSVDGPLQKKKAKAKTRQEEKAPESAELPPPPPPRPPESQAVVSTSTAGHVSDPVSVLDLLKDIKNRGVAQDRKIEQVYGFIKPGSSFLNSNRESVHFFENGFVPRYHFVTAVSEWVQGLIINSSKATNSHVKGKERSFHASFLEQSVAPCLDMRCWEILKWCLASGVPWNVGFVSLGILQSLSHVLDEAYNVVTEDALFYSSGTEITKNHRDKKARYSTEELFTVIHDVVQLLFCRYEDLFRPKLDLWVPLTISCLRIVSVSYSSTPMQKIGNVIFDIVILILQRFVTFLGSSPNPRKVFQSVIDLLLESLLCLRGSNSMVGFDDQKQKVLLGVVEDILRCSLFHRSHLDGYQNVCKLLKQSGSVCEDIMPKDEPSTVSRKENPSFLSYHKLLFQKLDYFVKKGNVRSLGSMAWLLRTYIQEVKAQMVLKPSTLLGLKNRRPLRGAASAKGIASDNQLLDQDIESGAEYSDMKRDSERVNLFAVFAEFMSPLLEEIEVLSHTFFLNNDFAITDLTRLKSLLSSANDLLLVVKEEHVYVPTEDTPTLVNLNFIKKIYSNFSHFNTALQKSYGEMTPENIANTCSAEFQALLMEHLNATISGVGYILELEYRVLEDDLEKIWMAVFFVATFQFTLGRTAQSELASVKGRVVDLASRIMMVFCELRQVERAIFSLCDFLRSITRVENPLFSQTKSSRKALESIVMSKAFLTVLSSVIREVPDGQIASFMRLLGEDIEQTLKMIQPSIVHTTDKHKILQQASIKVFTELYICILDHGNVTASNSIQFGASLRTLMDRCLTPFLGSLVDSAVTEGDIIFNYANVTCAQFESNGCPKEGIQHLSVTTEDYNSRNGRAIVSLMWALLLRLYMSVKFLYRRCVTLMPPKAARKVSISVNDPTLVLHTGESSKVEDLMSNECFFSCVKKGNISVFDVLSSIHEWVEARKRKKVEPLEYILLCIGIQSLADLKRQIKAVHYLLVEADFGTLDRSQNHNEKLVTDQSTASHVKYFRRHHKKLKRKAWAITSFLLRWIRDTMAVRSKSQTKQKSSGQLDSFDNSEGSWNKVLGSLSRQTLATARWGLLCGNLGVWSDFADPDDLKLFVRFMLEFTISPDNNMSDGKNECNMYSITKDILSMDSFYEEKAVREIFLQELCRQLEDNLSLSKLKLPLQTVIDYIETQGCSWFTYPKLNRSQTMCSEANAVSEDYSLNFTNIDVMQITKCGHLMNLVSRFPNGYIEAQSVLLFISFVLRIERCIVLLILNSRKNSLAACRSTKASQLLAALDLLVSCRRCLESLFLKNTVLRAAHRDASVISIVLKESFSMYWFAFSMRVIKFSVEVLNPVEDVSHKEVLLSLERCTKGLFSFCSENLFREYLKPLLVRSMNDKVSAVTPLELDVDLGLLFGNLVTEATYFAELMRSEGFSSFSEQKLWQEFNRKENTIRKEYPYGTVTFLTAISSILWNVTKTVESFDEICHLDKSGFTKWSDAFPDKLSSFMNTIGSFLTKFMQNILLIDDGVATESKNIKSHKYSEDKYVSQVVNAISGSEGKLHGDENHWIDVANTIHIPGQEYSEHSAAEIRDYRDVLREDREMDLSSDDDMHLHKDHHKKPAGEVSSISKHSMSDVVEAMMNQANQLSIDLPEISDAQTSILREMLSGKMPTLSNLLGELFISIAAILRLKSLLHSPNKINLEGGFAKHFSSDMICLHGGFASKILQTAAIMPQIHNSCQSVLLGATKYLESVGSFLPYAKPTYSPSAVVRFLTVQMSLCGSISSKLQVKNNRKLYEDLKSSVQNCFTTFLKRPLGLHLHLSLQTIERSLLGFTEVADHETMKSSYLSSSIQNFMLVAGIEYLAISLDAVMGTKRLQILSRYASRYLAAIFNLLADDQVLWHGLAGSTSYPKGHASIQIEAVNPLDWRTIAISKCIEILVIIASREVIFPMKSNHVAQAMSVPSVLFTPFYQRNANQLKLMQNVSTSTEVWVVENYKFLISDEIPALDLLLDVYKSCCKMLCYLLKHRKRESGHCIALLGESVRAMLFFLEILDLFSSSKHNGSGHIIECAIQCATGLRRVYEEIAEHKDTVGAYYAHLLSDYICVISGYGITTTGLSRRIEGTLRPGAYALVDSCLPDDLQQLHAVLGEGPRRTALSELKRDYEQHFKYTGKV